jgi:hypothetical protein
VTRDSCHLHAAEMIRISVSRTSFLTEGPKPGSGAIRCLRVLTRPLHVKTPQTQPVHRLLGIYTDINRAGTRRHKHFFPFFTWRIFALQKANHPSAAQSRAHTHDHGKQIDDPSIRPLPPRIAAAPSIVTCAYDPRNAPPSYHSQRAAR